MTAARARPMTIRCSKHRIEQPAYCVCCHVLEDGATVAMFSRATVERPGSIGCIACRLRVERGEKAPPGVLTMICAGCAAEKGFVPKDQLDA